MATSTDEKVRENRLRRMADRQGLKLQKSRRRDPLAIDFGKYWLIDADTHHGVVVGGRWGTSLDEVAEYLGDIE